MRDKWRPVLIRALSRLTALGCPLPASCYGNIPIAAHCLAWGRLPAAHQRPMHQCRRAHPLAGRGVAGVGVMGAGAPIGWAGKRFGGAVGYPPLESGVPGETVAAGVFCG